LVLDDSASIESVLSAADVAAVTLGEDVQIASEIALADATVVTLSEQATVTSTKLILAVDSADIVLSDSAAIASLSPFPPIGYVTTVMAAPHITTQQAGLCFAANVPATQIEVQA